MCHDYVRSSKEKRGAARPPSFDLSLFNLKRSGRYGFAWYSSNQLLLWRDERIRIEVRFIMLRPV